MDDPKAATPKTANDEPSRKKLLSDRVAPRLAISRTERHEPSRVHPKIEKVAPMRK
jgi:hypothetical protein